MNTQINKSIYLNTPRAFFSKSALDFVFAFALLFAIWSLAFNTRFVVHIGGYINAIFIFSAFMGIRASEILNKPVSFTLPLQRQSLGVWIMTAGIIFCLVFLTLGLNMLEINEDHGTYPLTQLHEAYFTIFLWSLAFYFIVVSAIIRSQIGTIIAYVAIQFLRIGTPETDSLAFWNMDILAAVVMLGSGTIFWRLINSRKLARKITGVSIDEAVKTTTVGIKSKVYDAVHRQVVNRRLATRKSHSTDLNLTVLIIELLSFSVIKMLMAIVFSLLVLSSLINGFESMKSIDAFYLYFYPLAVIVFPIFLSKQTVSPWLPISRKQVFVRTILQAMIHYLFAMLLLSLCYFTLSYLTQNYTQEKWFIYVSKGSEMSLASLMVLAVLAPITSFLQVQFKRVEASIMSGLLLMFIVFNVFENEVINIHTLSLGTVLLMSIVAWMPVLISSYRLSFTKDH